MKKRSLSLFLALLMVFGSVLPVFAVEPDTTPMQEEELDTGVQGEDAFYALYVPGATFNWMAYYADAEEFAGTTNLKTEEGGSVLSVTPNASGTAAYVDGYLRVVDGQLKVSDAYANATGEYTTEMIYASVNGQRKRNYTADFKTPKVPIFAEKVNNVFTVWGMNEDITFTDENGKALQEAWASAFKAASGGGIWLPISETDYNAMIAIPEQVNNVRANSAEVPAAGTYSTTGYEANYTGFVYVMTTLHKEWDDYYHGYNYTQGTKPGIGNSYVMKSEVALHGGSSLSNLTKDYKDWGPELGNWSRYDFGVVTSHTWKESYVNGKYTFTEYGDDVQTNTVNGSITLTTSDDFIVNGFDADYYAIRIYPFGLSDEQRQQNHFADLVNYVKIDNVDTFLKLSEDDKQALYAQFAETTFADADKAAIEAAIDNLVPTDEELEKEKAEHIAKYEKFAEMYVSGATTLWSAFGAKKFGSETVGVINEGTALTYAKNEGGTAAYGDGYLRVVNGQLKATGAYAGAPEEAGATQSHTTEMIYATVDGNRTRNYENGMKFETEYGVIFGSISYDVFTTWTVLESITFTDAAGRDMHERWAGATAAALNDSALQATFWAPISKADYETLSAIPEQSTNVRVVGGDSGVDPIADYSKTGYEANWAGYLYLLTTLSRDEFYHGYLYTAERKPGFANSYVMKTDLKVNGYGWYQNPDFDTFGLNGGYWTRHDFGVVTSHTWTETVKNNGDGKYNYQNVIYGDNVEVSKIGPANLATSKVTPSSDFVVNGFDADYYAIRIYPFVLNEAQKAQNHFVDLISFYDIDNVDMFEKLDDNSKTALYTAFASTMIKDTGKADLESAIVDAFVKNLSADTYVSFLGYQVKKYGNIPGLRGVFEVHKDGAIEGVTGVTLVEVGAIMAIAGDRTTADLTVAKTADGYVATGAQMMNDTVYADKIWAGLYEKDGVSTFGYTCTFEGITDKTKLQTGLLFRGYAVIEYEGVEFVIYTDMTSDVFDEDGPSISMYEASKYDLFADYDTSKAVIAAVEG